MLGRSAKRLAGIFNASETSLMSPTTPRQPIPIAFCITDLDAGGAERALVQIVMRLDRAEWLPQVFCLAGEGELAAELRAAGIPVTCFGARRWWNVGVLFRLRRALREMRPAVLQTFLYHANILGRIAGRFASVPAVVSGIRVAERRSRFRLWLDRVTERWVTRHVCVSRGVAEFSADVGGLSRRKLHVIPNGVDFERFATAAPADLSEFGIPSGDSTILFVGRLDPQKGTMSLLEAFGALAERRAGVHLLLVGAGPLENAVRSWIGEHGMDLRVHLAGRRDDIPELMRASDCLVLPSRWEGMPNVVLEAMAAGLPVVATRVEGTEELIRHEETGLLVPADDLQALSSALELTLEDRTSAADRADSAQNVVQNDFAWSTVAEAYAAMYRAITNFSS